eukprot:4341330-Amphidinium_carterae.3
MLSGAALNALDVSEETTNTTSCWILQCSSQNHGMVFMFSPRDVSFQSPSCGARATSNVPQIRNEVRTTIVARSLNDHIDLHNGHSLSLGSTLLFV